MSPLPLAINQQHWFNHLSMEKLLTLLPNIMNYVALDQSIYARYNREKGISFGSIGIEASFVTYITCMVYVVGKRCLNIDYDGLPLHDAIKEQLEDVIPILENPYLKERDLEPMKRPLLQLYRKYINDLDKGMFGWCPTMEKFNLFTEA